VTPPRASPRGQRQANGKRLESRASGKSVESAMKVLLDGRGVKRTGRENPFPLFNLLIGQRHPPEGG